MPLLKQSALTSSVRDKGLCLLNVVGWALCTDKYKLRGLLCCIYSYLSTGTDFNVALSGAADNGMTVSTSFDIGMGSLIDYNDDFVTEAQSDENDAAPELTIGYNGYTISAQQDGVDNLYNGDLPGADLGIAGSMGGVSFALTGDMEDDNTSYKLGYTMGDLTATVTGTNDENGVRGAGADGVAGNADDTGVGVDAAMKIALSYKMGDITLSAASDNEGAADSTNSVGVAYTVDAITVSYTAAGDKGADLGDDYDLKLTYSAGALTASFSTNEEDVTKMIATYDLGGATAFFSNKSETGKDYQAMGINFSF